MSSPNLRRPRFALGCAVAVFAAALNGPAGADPAPSFEALLARLGETPATMEADALLDAAEARVRQARVRPNPELGLEAENAFGTGPFQGYDNAETTLSLSQDLELWGRRRARVGVARAEVGTAALRRDLADVEAASRLALVYAEAEAAERRFQLAEEALTVTIADTRAALILVEEGREPLLRGIQGETEAAAARATLDEAQAERDAAFARLTAVAMLPTPVTSIDASLLNRTPAGVTVAVGAAPEVLVAEADRNAAEARLRASASRVAAADAGVTAAEEAYRLSRIGFEAGRISQLELRSSRTALINARNAAVDARLARVRAEIDLARLQGRAPFGTPQ